MTEKRTIASIECEIDQTIADIWPELEGNAKYQKKLELLSKHYAYPDAVAYLLNDMVHHSLLETLVYESLPGSSNREQLLTNEIVGLKDELAKRLTDLMTMKTIVTQRNDYIAERDALIASQAAEIGLLKKQFATPAAEPKNDFLRTGSMNDPRRIGFRQPL